jgi:hypothetical protein
MKILQTVPAILAVIYFTVPGLVSACTLDRMGDLPSISCGAPFMETHTINADGKSSIKFHGECSYSSGESAWNKHYNITATWDGVQAKEALSITGENKYGTVISTCPSNPWLNKVTCQKKSLSGAAFSDYQITGATTYPLTANAITDAQRAQLKAELAEKQKEVACTSAVIVSPMPAKGMSYIAPATVKIEIKHNPDFPPKEWVITWAPPTKQGDWPASPTNQNMSLSNLATSGGTTTGTLTTSKLGTWQIQSKVYFPSYCNKGDYLIPIISFTVREKTQGDKIVEDKLKNLPRKTFGDSISAPGIGPGPQPDWQKQNLQQQQLLQQQKLQQQKLQQQKLQ